MNQKPYSHDFKTMTRQEMTLRPGGTVKQYLETSELGEEHWDFNNSRDFSVFLIAASEFKRAGWPSHAPPNAKDDEMEDEKVDQPADEST
jgi:hypothetical protein